MRVTIPQYLYAISNGTLQKVDSLENGKIKYHWSVRNPINNYNIALHLGKYEQRQEVFASQNGKNLKVDYFFLEQDRELATEKLSIVPKMLEVYEKYFGPYPFIEDGFKIVQSPYPMEHQSCVAVIPNSL